MTPQEFREARQSLGLSISDTVEIMGLGKNGDVTVRRWELDPDKKQARAPNPIACKVLEYLLSGELVLKR